MLLNINTHHACTLIHRFKLRLSARFTEIEINDDVAKSCSIWGNHYHHQYQDVKVITNHFHAEKNYFMTIFNHSVSLR